MTSTSDRKTLARLDKWLWAVRIFKTRSDATRVCRTGGVTVNARPAKPSRDLQAGDLVVVCQGIVRRTLEVLGAPPSRVGAKIVPNFCRETTPAEEFAKAREQRVQQLLARTPGAGRPTKKDRRTIDRLFE